MKPWGQLAKETVADLEAKREMQAMSETIGHSDLRHRRAWEVKPKGAPARYDVSAMEESPRRALREEVNELIEALEMAKAEKTVLEEANRKSHRLRPLSEWTEADGEVIWYVDVEDEYPVVAIPRDLDGERFWVPLADRDKLWVR